MGGPTREAATDVFLRELPTIAEHGAVLILDDFHLVDESPDVRIDRARARGARAGAVVDRLRQPPDAADPARPDARRRRGRRDRHRRSSVRRRPRRPACSPRRTGASSKPDVLADVAARTEGWAASLQLVQAALRDRSPGRDPALRPWPDRRRPGALRLPRRGGRRRPARGPAAVPHANVDPAGRHRGARRRSWQDSTRSDVRSPHRCRRAPDAPQPTRALSRGPQRYHPLVREFLEARLRSTVGSAGRRRAPPSRRRSRRATSTGASPPTTTARPATLRRSRPVVVSALSRNHVQRRIRRGVGSSSTARPLNCVPLGSGSLRHVSVCNRVTTRGPSRPREPSCRGNRSEASETTLS